MAIYDGHTLIRDYSRYTSVESAIAIGRSFIKERTDKEPKICRPTMGWAIIQ